MHKSRSSIRAFSTIAALIFVLMTTVLVFPAHSGSTGEEDLPVDWQSIDKLVSEQKLQAAVDLVGEIRTAAAGAQDFANWTRALVEEVQLRTALHGYETAVRFLMDQEWPDDPTSKTVLELFYANSLVTYANSYSWEIRQRERIVSTEDVDLKQWTFNQIVGEAHLAFSRVWSERSHWGDAPIGSIARFIEQNDYPPRIRGALRDAVGYLWVELLADTSMWTPEQSNEIFRLDLDALINPDPENQTTLELAQPDLHPLAKIGAILKDLELWHLGADRPEAALEAQLKQLEIFNSSFTIDEDRIKIRSHLESILQDFDSSLEWWSMGIAKLAELIRAENDSKNLIRAREVAIKGRDRHPDSPGGALCGSIITSIEAQSYSLSAMASDGIGRRSLRIDHRNLTTIYLRAYHYDLLARITSADDSNLLPRDQDVEQLLATSTPDAEWTVQLAPTPDYKSHATDSIPPIKTAGAYIIVASARRDFKMASNHRVAIHFISSDLVLLGRQLEGGVEITARSGASGRPLAGVDIQLYRYDWRQGRQLASSKTSGDDGRVFFDSTEITRQQHFVFGIDGANIAFDESYYPRSPAQERETTSSLLYTDRSVYRPRQTIFFKAVAYTASGDQRSYRTLADSKITITLKDANYQTVDEQILVTNEFGSASGQFEIPSGRLLGAWQLSCSLGGSSSLRVEEYKRPTFTVEVTDPEKPLRLNHEAELSGEVRYYFGLPVTDGEVKWRISREPIYPRWLYWWRPVAPAAPQIISSGIARLDEEGRFFVNFTPEADERQVDEPGISFRFRLSADVTGAGGETRSASRAFRLGFVAVEAQFVTEKTFFQSSEIADITVSRTDLNAIPQPGAGSWRLVTLEQPKTALLPADLPIKADHDEYASPDDQRRTRWSPNYSAQQVIASWKEARTILEGQLDHGEDGKASIALRDLKPGVYRLIYKTDDDFGATFTTQYDIIIAGEQQTPLALPALLLVNQSSAQVGETLTLLVRSGLSDQEMVLEVFYDAERRSRQILHSGISGELIEIPVDETMRGGFSISLTLLRDHQIMHENAAIFVPWDDRKLNIEIETFRDKIRPGSHEIFKFHVTTNDGAPLGAGVAEVLAYMYDTSLDIFAPHTPPNAGSLYPRRGAHSGINSTLSSARTVWQRSSDFGTVLYMPHFRGDSLKRIDGYGIGGPGGRNSYPVYGMMAMRSKAMAPPSASPAGAVAEAPMAETAEAQEANDSEFVLALQDTAPPSIDNADSSEIRSDFSETAFFMPHLLLDENGGATIEFDVPDSVTEWNLWMHALTRDLRWGTLNTQTRSVKDLMVRPYLPRFLREGDTATIKVVINNAGDHDLTGELDFAIFDPETDEDLGILFGLETKNSLPFEVASGGGTNLGFAIKTPSRIGPIGFRVRARADGLTDGEQRDLPILPGRLHLAQSRFVSLTNKDSREMHFADLRADDDASRIDDQLIVSVDAQLFYGVLNALPYLVNYPYKCVEQSLNRFVSTGILTSLYEQYPAVATMAKKLSQRETQFEAWDANDANRKMTLEETPWLVTSQGGDKDPDQLSNVLDPRIAQVTRDEALGELRKSQTSIGAFPWWPGGPPSPYMTLYVVYGFSKGLEFGIEPPRDMVVRAWSYLHQHYVEEIVDRMMANDCSWETITFLNYVLSNYPDDSWTGAVFTADDQAVMLDFSFRHWKQHSPLLKSYLALTLDRAGRHQDAALVFDSVMDSAKTERDLGAFWAPEDRAWLWYNDTIETHAFALRTLGELDPADSRRHGLVHWIFLNKKLNHWKSTRATSEVIYSLAHYLKAEGTLGVAETIDVQVGSRAETFNFDPDEYSGNNAQVVIKGGDIDPKTMSTIIVEKASKGIAFATATWHFSTERLPDEARGDLFHVERRYFKRVNTGEEWLLEPLEDGTLLNTGDQVEVQLSLRAAHAAEYVHLRDPRGAGLEPENVQSRYRWDLGIGCYEEIRDSGANFFFERLPAGEYTFSYRLRANMAGRFRVGPAVLQSMYAPEFTAYSAGHEIQID